MFAIGHISPSLRACESWLFARVPFAAQRCDSACVDTRACRYVTRGAVFTLTGSTTAWAIIASLPGEAVVCRPRRYQGDRWTGPRA